MKTKLYIKLLFQTFKILPQLKISCKFQYRGTKIKFTFTFKEYSLWPTVVFFFLKETTYKQLMKHPTRISLSSPSKSNKYLTQEPPSLTHNTTENKKTFIQYSSTNNIHSLNSFLFLSFSMHRSTVTLAKLNSSPTDGKY